MDESIEAHSLIKLNQFDFFCARISEVMPHVKFPIRPSKEDAHSLGFVTRGKYTSIVGNEKVQLGRGESILIPAGSIFSVPGEQEWTDGYAIHFNSKFLTNLKLQYSEVRNFPFLHVGANPHIHFDTEAVVYIEKLFERLHVEFKANGVRRYRLLQSYVCAILEEVKCAYEEGDKPLISVSERLYRSFLKLVHENILTNKKPSEFADLLNVSPNHLNKTIKGVSGKSATQVISELRLTEIKFYFFQTELSVSEVAQEFGFEDPSYFSRWFKKWEGVTPAEYRRMIEKS